MDNILSIQWSTGHMTIYMPAFFPCTAGKLNKLKKYIAMDVEHAEALFKQMQAFFRERIPECEEVFQREGKAYWNYQDRAADYEHQLANGKTPVGLPLTKEQKKDWKKYAKDCAASARACKRSALQAKKQKEWFEAHLEGGTEE